MQHKRFWAHLQSVCIRNAAMKSLSIPIALITAQMLSSIIDFATAGEVETVIRYSLVLLGFVLLCTALRSYIEIIVQKRQVQADNACRLDFIERFLNAPLHALFRANYGELMENLNNDLDALIKRYAALYPSIISSALGVFGYVLFLLLQNPLAAVSLLCISLLQLVPPVVVKKYMQVNYDQCRDMEAKITNHVVEAVDGFETIKLYGLKQWWLSKIIAYQKDYLVIGQKSNATLAAQVSMNRLVDNILKFGTYGLMGAYVMLGHSSIEVAVQAIYLSSGLFDSVRTFFSVIPEFAVSRSAESRLDKWKASEETSAVPQNLASGQDIVANNLTFGYEGQKIFDSFHYTFSRDKSYLLKGSNGAGKTTLIGLLAGLILPDSGTIQIDGVPTVPHRVSDPHQLFLVPQHDPEYCFDASTLFHMFGDELQPALTATAKRLGLTDEILSEQEIRHLSGGERKKVFLAIGFAINPQWLLLDEPSNNLDTYGKKALAELIGERKGVILISHDASLAEAVDCCVTLTHRQGGCNA